MIERVDVLDLLSWEDLELHHLGVGRRPRRRAPQHVESTIAQKRRLDPLEPAAPNPALTPDKTCAVARPARRAFQCEPRRRAVVFGAVGSFDLARRPPHFAARAS